VENRSVPCDKDDRSDRKRDTVPAHHSTANPILEGRWQTDAQRKEWE